MPHNLRHGSLRIPLVLLILLVLLVFLVLLVLLVLLHLVLLVNIEVLVLLPACWSPLTTRQHLVLVLLAYNSTAYYDLRDSRLHVVLKNPKP